MVFDRFGGPEVLELREVPDPACAPDEVVVNVRACAVNHLDLWVRMGLRGLDIAMPHILGNDVVGEAAEVGSAVRHVKPGDKVLVNPMLSCGMCAACLRGDDNQCRSYDVLGRMRNGGYAEKVSVPGVNCMPYPENLPWEQAAAVPLVFLTAWHMLVARADLRAGEDVLVIGAGSGVGSAAIQIARMLGARVITTAGSGAKLERAKSLGAHDVIDHTTDDVAARVKALTGKKGADVVFEHVGGAVFENALGALARNGRLVTCGATAGSQVTLDINLLFGKHQTLLGSYMGRRRDLAEVLEFVRAGRLAPVVDSVMPLADARKAHRRIEAREHFGKVVLTP
jgi:NADPH:quinone reductase-like Zn-dependent oxidoreductase